MELYAYTCVFSLLNRYDRRLFSYAWTQWRLMVDEISYLQCMLNIINGCPELDRALHVHIWEHYRALSSDTSRPGPGGPTEPSGWETATQPQNLSAVLKCSSDENDMTRLLANTVTAF